MIELSIYIIATLVAALLIGWVALQVLRFTTATKRSLKVTHLKVLMPRKDSDQDERKETSKDFKEQIGLMEQLLSSLNSIYSGKIQQRVFWQHTITFEYVSLRDETFFYVSIHKDLQTLLEKQLTSFYPDAVIDEVHEPELFHRETKCYSNTILRLAKDFVYPIKTHQKLEADPINPITNALSKLSEEEACSLQVILQPVKWNWQSKASKKAAKLQKGSKKSFSLNPFKWIIGTIELFTSSDPKTEGTPDEQKENSALENEIIQAIDEKGKKVGYDTLIRILCTGNSQVEADNQMKNIVSSFEQFDSPNTNSFKMSYYHHKAITAHNHVYRRFTRLGFWNTSKCILNAEEIASIFHFPHSKFNTSPEIKWQNFKIAKAPTNIPKEGLLLWWNVYRGVKKPIYIKNEDRFRHFYVLGQTGSGKSVILNGMAIQDVREGRGICVMDPHGDLALDVLPHIPRERADDVIYFNPGDTDRPMGVNLLEADSEDEKEIVAQDANKMMIKLFWNEVFWPRIQDYFMNSVLTLMDYPDGWTLIDVMPMVSNQDFQKIRRNTLKNKIVKSWWENMYDAQADREKKEILPYFQAKFSAFSTNEMMRNIIGQTKSSFNVSNVMDSNGIMLMNLSKWLLGDLNSNLLGMIFVSKIQTAALRRQKIAKEERVDFFFYIDEFQNFVTDSIESILSEARKYRLSLNMAHQYIKQLEKGDAISKSSINLKDAVFGNVANKLIYRVGAEDGEFMSKDFWGSFSDKDFVNQDALKATMKLSVDNQPSQPFSINVMKHWEYFPKPDNKLANAYIELSRLKYGREKAFVDKEIMFRIG